MSWFTVRVPASSANLGPGFDALGMALGVYLDCRFRAAGRLAITVTGRDAAAISTGEDNLIWQTALSVAADVGMPMPPIELAIANRDSARQGTGIERRRAHGRRGDRGRCAGPRDGARRGFWMKPRVWKAIPTT